MTLEDLAHLALAVALTAVAGCVDAIGFLKLGHVFVSFMSGDSTQLAVAVGRARWSEAAQVGGVVALFLAGAAGGQLLAKRTGRWRRCAVLAVDALLLAFAGAIGSGTDWVIAPMVLAMGVQNAAVHRAGPIPTGLTYVTGTLVSLGDAIADAVNARWDWAPYLGLWVGLVIGALAGALAYAAFGLRALFIPAAAAAALAAVTGAVARRGRN